MCADRLDKFEGDDLAYIGYLYREVTNATVPDLLRRLEGQVRRLRNNDRQSSGPPSDYQSEYDEAHEYEDRVINSPNPPFTDNGDSKASPRNRIVESRERPPTQGTKTPVRRPGEASEGIFESSPGNRDSVAREEGKRSSNH